MTHPCIHRWSHTHKGVAFVLHYGVREDGKYVLLEKIVYHSPRYCRDVTVPVGYVSDGATGAPDLMSRASWIHDWLCDNKAWQDGTPCNHWQRSMVIGDVLAEEGHSVRRWTWPLATWLAGVCGMG